MSKFTLFLTFQFLLLSLVCNSQTVGIKVVSNGDVGIGLSSPEEKLDVDGAIRVSDTTNPCTSINAGAIRWNGTCFEGCDGTSWIGLSNDPACGGGGGATPTCSDGIQNQGETGIDCGGPCPACTCQSGCECFPDIDGARSMSNTSWANEFNVGGAGIAGDGELCWKLGAITNNSRQVIGFNNDPHANANFNTIDYGLLFQVVNGNFKLRAYENGSASSGWIYNSANSYSGSTFCIRRSGTTIEYIMDGSVLYSISGGSTAQMYFDNSFYDSPTHSAYGVRPCDFNVEDIKFCPNGTYTRINQEREDDQTWELDPKTEGESENSSVVVNPNFSIFSSLTSVDKLKQNVPNPFSDETVISLNILDGYNSAHLEITNSQGVKIESVELDEVGFGVVRFDTSELASGIYYYSLIVDGSMVDTKKMIKLR